MKKIAMTALLAVSPLALADGYMNLGVSNLELTGNDIIAAKITGGYSFTPWLALEGSVIKGIEEDGPALEASFEGAVKIAPLKGSLFSPYVKGTFGSYAVNSYGNYYTTDDYGYAVGIEYLVDEKYSLGLEYASMIDEDVIELDGVTLFLGINF